MWSLLGLIGYLCVMAVSLGIKDHDWSWCIAIAFVFGLGALLMAFD